jgi:hypothetical protein
VANIKNQRLYKKSTFYFKGEMWKNIKNIQYGENHTWNNYNDYEKFYGIFRGE